jgi:2-hydroxychromene-2-carboxylate isomerase
MREVLPLKRELGDALELGIGYIGTVDDEGHADFAHGDAEVEAAEIQVCVGLESSDREWIGFMSCLYEGDAWAQLPRGWTRCASQAGVDIEAVTTCVDDGDGRETLGRAIEAAAASGIDAAPTALLDGKLYLGGRTHDELLTWICYAAGQERTRPALCAEVEPPPRVGAVLLSDRRCVDPDLCDVSQEVGFLGLLMPTLAVEEVDFASERGRALHAEILAARGPRHLPLLVLDAGLADYPHALEQLADYLLAFGDGYVMPLGQGWDPLAEICDGGIDDDGDGAVDCADADCAQTLPCREELPARIDLFMMSQCPFATELIPSLDHLVTHFGRDPERVDVRLQFIGHVEDGELRSMHGPDEVDEDLRLVCAQELYRARYRYLEYARCRAQDARSTDWEACLPKGTSAEKIRACAAGERGRALLEASFAQAEAMGVRGSPTWIVNNRFEAGVGSAADLRRALCEHNDLPACAQELAPEPEAAGGPTEKCE